MKPNLDRLKEDIGTSVVYDVVPNAEREIVIGIGEG